tara:strand:+ start:56 stop:910 length:855 start_codon:yes stop_codon:yes gene_type:complete
MTKTPPQRPGKRIKKKASLLPIIGGVAVMLIIVAVAYTQLKPDPRLEVPYLGRGDVVYDVQIGYQPGVNYCRSSRFPLDVIVTSEKDVEAPQLGYWSDTLTMAQTGVMEGRIALSPLKAGEPSRYVFEFQREKARPRHELWFYPTLVEDQGLERPVDVSPPLLILSRQQEVMRVNSMERVQFYIANCGDIPLADTEIEIWPSAPIEITRQNPYQSYEMTEVEGDIKPWHLRIDAIPTGSVTPVQFQFIPKAATEQLTFTIEVKNGETEKGSDTRDMPLGSVTGN